MNENADKIWQLLASYNYPAKSGLDYINEFTFLVGVLLSAQAQDAFINTQTPEFFKAAPDSQSMHALGVEEIARYVQRIGLWRNKSLNIHKLAKQVQEFKKIKADGKEKEWYDSLVEKCYTAGDESDFNDDLHVYGPIISDEGIPSFRLGLIQLAGIGRKSANVFLNVVYNAPTFPVDTHVQRVGSRLGVVEGNNPVEMEYMMKSAVPHEYAKVACHMLVWHGRKVCFAKKPDCAGCKLKNYCNFVKK